MGTTFTLDPAEVTVSWTGSRTGRRTRVNRASAAVDTSSWSLRLTHRPTGVEVQGEVPPGSYGNAQMKEAKEKLHQDLVERLLREVARHLRLPGR